MSRFTCNPCGRVFNSLAAFDRHQDVDYHRPRPVVCRDPASVGLVPGPGGRWHFPLRPAAAARLAALKARGARPGT